MLLTGDRAHRRRAVCTLLRASGHRGAVGPRLASFLRELETHAIIGRVACGLVRRCLRDPLADDSGRSTIDRPGLRAPIVAHWAVTYRCNLSCAFCYAESGPAREPEPAPGGLAGGSSNGWRPGACSRSLIGGGEPTVLPDLPELLAAIRAGGMVPNVTTNGTHPPP